MGFLMMKSMLFIMIKKKKNKYIIELSKDDNKKEYCRITAYAKDIYFHQLKFKELAERGYYENKAIALHRFVARKNLI